MSKNICQQKYQTTIKELVNEVKKLELQNYKEIVNNEEDILNNGYSIVNYLENCNKLVDDFSTKNAIVFSQDNLIIEGIDFFLLWNQELSDSTRDNIWKYLFTLYLYAYSSNENLTLSEIVKKYKDTSGVNYQKPCDKILFAIIDNLNSEKRIKKLAEKEKDTIKESSASNFDFPLGEGLLNGEIGKLAKEIAEEINPADFESQLENQNPQELLSNLFAGNMQEESPIFNLVQTISSKIQNKVSQGGINENALFQEAQDMVGNNSMFRDMMDKANQQKNTDSSDKLNKRKKILRQKLKDKRKKTKT